jgi:hypothetical protein
MNFRGGNKPLADEPTTARTSVARRGNSATAGPKSPSLVEKEAMSTITAESEGQILCLKATTLASSSPPKKHCGQFWF